MRYFLMNKDIVTMSLDDCTVFNKQWLPNALNTNYIFINKVNNWLNHRALSLNRENAEKLYQAVGLPRDKSGLELFKLTHGLSINDNFWVASESEIGKIKYKDINLYTNSLNNAMYLVALKGENYSLTGNSLSAEFTGQGMFPKCFVREQDGIYIYKSGENLDIIREVYAAFIAKLLGLRTVDYQYTVKFDRNCTRSKIMTNLDFSWESALSLIDFGIEGFKSIQNFALDRFKHDLSNMAIFDGIVLNMDRHMKNWSFLVDNSTNKIVGLAPSYDYNKCFEVDQSKQSMLLPWLHTNILNAARYCYCNLGTTLKIDYLYNVLNSLDLKINKASMLRRIEYITGLRQSAKGCYEV